MIETKKQYRKYTIEFRKRNLVLLELDYVELEKSEIEDEVDLLVTDKTAEILVQKVIYSTYNINVNNYEDILFRIKKQLELQTRTDVLKLILDRDETVIDFILQNCNQNEVLQISAALAVFSDTYLHRTNKLTLVIDEELFEQFKATSVHEFFKLYFCQDLDDRIYRFKPYFYFARRVFLELEKEF